MKHIMVLFLSLFRLQGRQFAETEYRYRDGTAYTCVQTNESAVRYLHRELSLCGEELDSVFYFASQGIRDPLAAAGADGKELCLSHEEWFRRRIRAYCPSLRGEEAFVSIPYDESADTEQGIRQIAAMAQAISDFIEAKHWRRSDVILHADMTGGLRHASMMMLTVMQLLKYSGIQTQHVLYSNWQEHRVEDVTDIYRTFSLISGADEFIHFGSVREIETYFSGKSNSAELQQLLKAMHGFSDTIKICRVADIEPALQSLYGAMEAFRAGAAKTLQEELFMKVLDIFKAEYGDLLTGKATQNGIIRWCLQKGYLQQAMTLCTEWIPHQLVEQQIWYPGSEAIRRECCKEKNRRWKSWEQYFIVDFHQTESASEGRHTSDNLRNRIAEAVRQNDGAALSPYPEVKEKTDLFLSELCAYGRIFQQVKAKTASAAHLQTSYPYTYRTVQSIWKKNCRSSTYHKGFFQCWSSLTEDKLLNGISTFSLEEFSGVLQIDLQALEEPQKQAVPAYQLTAEEKWRRREKEYVYFLEQGWARTKRPVPEALEILRGYYRIRQERNAINHASTCRGMSTETMNELILSVMKLL